MRSTLTSPTGNGSAARAVQIEIVAITALNANAVFIVDRLSTDHGQFTTRSHSPVWFFGSLVLGFLIPDPPTPPPLRNRATTAKIRGRKASFAPADRESRRCPDLAACESIVQILAEVLSPPRAVGNPGRDCRRPRGSPPAGPP